ncbi:MAG: Hsp20/alpha crystallin family protein [Cytophagales bacterium]
MKAIANEVSRDLIKGVNLGNTVLGGMSESYFKHVDAESEYVIEVRTPGLTVDNYSIDLKNNTLFLYSTMSAIKDGGKEEKSPYLMRHFTLPYYIDLEAVVADFYNGTLKVTLPYKYMKDGFEKRIEIKE